MVFAQRLDRYLSRLIKPALDGVDKTLAGAGLTANALTLSVFFIGTLAAAAIALHSYGISLAAIAASRVCDGLDGALPVKPSPLTGAAETYALFAAMCIWLLHFAVLAYAFAVVWAVTTRYPGVVGLHSIKLNMLPSSRKAALACRLGWLSVYRGTFQVV